LLLISHIGVFGLIFAECSNTKNRQIPTLLKAYQLRLQRSKKSYQVFSHITLYFFMNQIPREWDTDT